MQQRERLDPRDVPDLSEKVVFINRVSKVVKGGRRFSFSAVVVVGDGRGHVGAGMGKANEVPDAIRKGAAIARKNLFRVPMVNGTVPHAWRTHYGAAQVLIKPAPPGTGVIAGGGVRAVLEQAGVKDVVAKSLGSNNAVNVVRCAIKGLQELRDPAGERQRRMDAQAAPTQEIREPRPERRIPREQRENRERERAAERSAQAAAIQASTAPTAAADATVPVEDAAERPQDTAANFAAPAETASAAEAGAAVAPASDETLAGVRPGAAEAREDEDRSGAEQATEAVTAQLEQSAEQAEQPAEDAGPPADVTGGANLGGPAARVEDEQRG